MTIFYRGAGIGTWWHERDARAGGVKAKAPAIGHSLSRVMHHVARADFNSPYISLTRSFGVAHNYAVFGRVKASKDKPGYVYEIEFSGTLPIGVTLIDPIQYVARNMPNPLSDISYQHDGEWDFLSAITNPQENDAILRRPVRLPPTTDGTTVNRYPKLTMELETLVRALPDSEILARGTIPRRCVRVRHSVW